MSTIKRIVCIFFILHLSLSDAQTLRKKLIYGLNGHPLTQESYAGNIDLQLNLLKELKCKFYRIDVSVDTAGKVVNEKMFLDLISKSQKVGIKLLPVLVLNKRVYDAKPTRNLYNEGLIYGTNFVKRYKTYFDYYEVGNEEGTNVIVSAEVDGDKAGHYDASKPKKIMPYFRGICEAIKRGDPTSKIIINEGWVHYGFFELLRLYKVKYDIIGYHGYSDMGDISNARKGFGNVIDTLYKKFHKKIWVTEMNVRNGSSMKLDPVANEWFVRNVRSLYNSDHVGAIFVYELLDQPAFDNPASPYNNPLEAYYGLAAWESRYTRIRRKPIFNVYKSFIQAHP